MGTADRVLPGTAGFTIMGGTNALGGCVYLNASSPTFEDVIFTGCQGAKGGAVHVTGGASECGGYVTVMSWGAGGPAGVAPAVPGSQ